MAKYNENIYKSYLNNRDYTGAANYLSTCTAIDGKHQDYINNVIRELSINGEKQAAMLEEADEESQAAYHFISSLDGAGTIPHKDNNGENGNVYGDMYVGFMNTLHVNKKVISPGGRNVQGEKINRIRIEFNNTSAYKQYLDAIGTNFDDVYELEVNTTKDSKTGRTFMDIPTNNVRLMNLIKNLSVLDTTTIMPSITGTYVVQAPSLFSIKGVTSSNIVVSKDNFNFDNIQGASRLINRAREQYDNIIENSKTKEVYERMYVTPYLGLGHANAYRDKARGLLSQEDYDKIVRNITDTYDRLLRLASFQDKEVYLADEDTKDKNKEASILKLVAPQDKDDLKNALNVAIEDKRVTYAAGLRNGVVGTYIEVSQKIDNKGKPIKGDYTKAMTIFVPGLFKSSCDEAFNADTKQKSVRDYADMTTWNYGRFLKDGNYIGHNKEIGDYIQKNDENGNAVKIPISKEEMLQLLNKNNIIEGSVSKLLSYIGSDGKPIEHLSNGQMVPYNIEQQAQLLSAAGTAELYPKGAYNDGERISRQVDIYNIIMKQLSNILYKRNKNN